MGFDTGIRRKKAQGVYGIVLSVSVVVACVVALYVIGAGYLRDQPATVTEEPSSPAKVRRGEAAKVLIERGDWLRETFPGISVAGVYEDEAGAYIYIAFQTQEQLDAVLKGGAMPTLLDGVRVVIESRPLRVEALDGRAG